MDHPNAPSPEDKDGILESGDDLNARFELNEFGETVRYQSGHARTSEKTGASSKSEIPATIGRYEVQGVLGSGAFGAVYLGYDEQLDRDVAIKVPRLELTPDTTDKFFQEARQLAKVTHPGIVTVFDVGIANGLCYIVSDFLNGENLNHWLRDHQPSWQESARLIAGVADALAAAHSRSVIHRDVKPANIILAEHAGGFAPVLVDFGLALSEPSKGHRGVVSGTPDYMSPEQARGEGHRIDGRTDIYALGVILYRMICGRLPFEAASVFKLLQMVKHDEPQPPRQRVLSIPRELERICLKAMAKTIADRYTTAGDMAADLRRLLKQHAAEVEASQAAVRAQEDPRPQSAIKILVADDQELSRFKLQTDLEKWGHAVTVAEDGDEAWQLFQQGEFSIVITDWMMPRVDGLELVRRIRRTEQADYVYVIILTAKSEMQDIISGLSAGADDFLTKPVHRDELQVRVRAGARITRLNRELNETNRRMRRSLDAAGRIQQAFLPSTKPEVAGFDFAWDHRSSVGLGGDMLNIVRLDEQHLGLYVLDVNGEGVPAALLAADLSRVMSASTDPATLLVERAGADQKPRIRQPSEVARRLNERFAAGGDGRQYFTLVYGVLNLESREFRYTNAGHPPVLHQQADSAPVMLDATGYPIGLAPEAETFTEQSIQLQPGDRLLLYSDGLPDTMSPEGDIFGAARILESATKHYPLSLDEMVRMLMKELVEWRGTTDFEEDVSVLICTAA